jgi:outer membrane protein assembly factor BamB
MWGCARPVPPSPVSLASGSTFSPVSPLEPAEPGPAPVEELGLRDTDEQQSPAKTSPNAPSERAPVPVTDTPNKAPVDDASATTGLPSDAWPDFRNGPQLRGIANTSLSDTLELLWELPTKDGVQSTAAIADGRVYIGTTEGFLLCLDLRDGQELWRHRSIESTDPDDFAPGFMAPVTLSATAVFAGDEDGVLHAVDRETGKPLWKVPTEGLIKGGAALLPDGRVMIGSHGGHLYGLNVATGEKVWDVPTQGPVNGTQALTGQYTFVTGCDKPVLRVVDVAAGSQHAEVTMTDPRDARNVFLLIASPAVDGDVLYFGTDGGEVVAFDWKKQEFLWINSDEDRSGQIDSSPALTDTSVLIGTGDRRLLCLERATGKERWHFETRGPIAGSPVVVGNRVFFGSGDRNLYAARIDDGAEAWKFNAGQRFTASPAVGEGRLVIGADQTDGKIYCFGAR